MNDLVDLEEKDDNEAVRKQGNNPYLSNTFKLWIVALIFFLIIFHTCTIITYPQENIVSNEIILGIALAMIVYLWIQELRDRQRLLLLNKAIIAAGERLKKAEIDTISVLVLTLEAKDPYVRGHSKRVAQYSLAIAKEMGFSKEKQMIIERAGILHDIGKLGIMDEILKKPDKLNDEEWKIMKKHPERSVEILKPLEFLFQEKEIILHHHERYDGGGYPKGLKGEDIPLGARIMSVADTFDAMNSERPYRKSLPREVILSELKRVSGSQLESAIVSIFLNLLKKNPELWEKN